MLRLVIVNKMDRFEWMDYCQVWSSVSEMTSDRNPETTPSTVCLLFLIDVLGLSSFVSGTMLEPCIDWTFVLLF